MRCHADRLQLQICWSYQTILNVSCPNAESYEALSTSLRKQTTMNEIQGRIKKKGHFLITKQFTKFESSIQVEYKTAFLAVSLDNILTKTDLKYISVQTVAGSLNWVEDIMYNQF